MTEERKIKASDIAKKWQPSSASTVAPEEVNALKNSAPEFGMLKKTGGRVIYAFLGGEDIKKLVLPETQESLQNNREIIAQIQKAGFSLRDLHRTRH